MAVTELQVQTAFESTDGFTDPDKAREELVKKLTPLFNDGGGAGSSGFGFTFTQSAPSTLWGPISHTFERRANVFIADSTGRQTFGEVIEAVVGSVIIKFANPKSGSARLS